MVGRTAPASGLPAISPTFGDQQIGYGALPATSAVWQKLARHPISLLAGEMPGRAEGGVTDRGLRISSQPSPDA
ncbi:MAG: hypothetical protein E5X33_24800 [Mesorhizobium sp.]|nr:MAG: hypothetical protein EOR22_19705 [Mesorhizobium sp.]TIQ05987.1 MAG: hypothetical protein E5X50_20670 [Mesorhizobium sp.]TIR17815.1 MAG: hypothetical protein E5X33_24800 [Mesorhizobium sp.]